MESFFYKFANQYVTMAKNSYGLFEYFAPILAVLVLTKHSKIWMLLHAI